MREREGETERDGEKGGLAVQRMTEGGGREGERKKGRDREWQKEQRGQVRERVVRETERETEEESRRDEWETGKGGRMGGRYARGNRHSGLERTD